MSSSISSTHHARTTLDIDTPILRDLKRLQTREGKSLGRLASDLLGAGVRTRERPSDQHGIKRLYANNMDFRKFEFLQVRNPLVNDDRGR